MQLRLRVASDRALVRVERVGPATPGVLWLIEQYIEKYGGEPFESNVRAIYHGAYEHDRLIAVMGWVDLPKFRYVDVWATVGGRAGRRGSVPLVALARQRRVVGMIALENAAARAWASENGAKERAVWIDLPPKGR